MPPRLPPPQASLCRILLDPRPRSASSYTLYPVGPCVDGGSRMERAVVLGAARTPFGKFGGALSPLSAPELGGATIREAIDRSGVEDGELEHSIFGIVVQAGVGQIPSRQANFHAGLPFSLTTETLNQVCASGMRSATLAETMVRCGDYDVLLAVVWRACRTPRTSCKRPGG